MIKLTSRSFSGSLAAVAVAAMVAASPASAGIFSIPGTWAHGSDAPDSGDGVDGDVYYDTTEREIYGPKSAGAWAPAWHAEYDALTLEGTWANYDSSGSGYEGAQMTKSNGVVTLAGLVKRTGTLGSTITILDAGHRPAERHVYGLLNLTGTAQIARVDVKTDGTVELVTDPGTAISALSLDGISFVAD